MTRRAGCVSVAVAAVTAGLVSSAASHAGGSLGGFASLRAAASSVSTGCARIAGLGLPPIIAPGGSNAGFALSTGASGKPLVSAAVSYVPNRTGTYSAVGIFSSHGRRTRLPDNVEPVALWPCRRPVVFYFGYAKGDELWMQALGAGKSVSLGTVNAPPATFDSRGRLVSPPPAPAGWHDARFAPSPIQPVVSRQPSVFLAEFERNCTGSGQNTGRLYVISRAGSKKLSSYDSCINPPLAVWSPDGSRILWATTSGTPAMTRLHIADSSGGAARTLATVKGTLGWALWSPDGRTVAYTVHTGVTQIADADVATGAIHRLTHIRRTPSRPPGQPPYARVIGWSRDSKRVLALVAAPNGTATSVEAFPAAGGKPTVLIRLPRWPVG